MKKYFIMLFFSIPFISCDNSDNPEYPFRDTRLSIDERVEDLLSRLTLEEKVSMMRDNNKAIDRLGIPAYNWQNESLHGVAKIADYKVTVFPQPIGLAASWDKEAILEVCNCISDEGRAIYHETLKRQGGTKMFYGLTYWAPNINIFRDPRWGRGHETFGEDPYLTGNLGKAFVRGVEGNDSVFLKASACAKHYAVHSGPESLRHEFNTEVSNYDLWDTYLSAFRDLIVDAKVSGVMCAYNAYGGRPCCGNDLLMMDILRNKWKFDGYVTSDCGAIDDFYKYHRTHPDTISAAADAVLHGTDLDCVRDVVFKTLVQAVKEGRLSEKDIDKSVRRLLTVRFRLGMFDGSDFKYANIPLSVLDCDKHKDLALKLSRESIVLLKNENKTLPLDKNIRKLAVVGPNADKDLVLLGNYHGYPSKISTVLEGIKGAVSPQTEVVYKQIIDYTKVDDFVSMNLDDCCSYNGLAGFKAEYYKNVKFEGEPILNQEKVIDLHYRGKTPIIGDINSSAFSVKYETVFAPQKSGEYTLNTDTDRKFELYVDGKLCMDNNIRNKQQDGQYTQYFEAGKQYSIKLNVIFKSRHADLSFNIGKTQKVDLSQVTNSVKDADAIVFVGGISPAFEGEGGDRKDILLPKIQTQLMRELKATGKPVIFVMMTGSALAINWENENIPAILNVWYGGQATGEAVADVLFGDYNPSGRLPITFYKSEKDLPSFTDYNMEGRTYRYFKGKTLYPFGFGLSYTKFEYRKMKVSDKIGTNDSLKVEVDVVNVGTVKGDEVSQLYLTHLGKEDYLPIRALKGFERITLEPGEKKTISFVLTPRDLATFNDFSECSVRPGNIMISVGCGQPDKSISYVKDTVEIEGNVKLLPM